MTDHELLRAIYNNTQGLKTDVQRLKQDTQELKPDVQGLKERIKVLEDWSAAVESRIEVLENRIMNVELTLENEIRDNIKRVVRRNFELSRELCTGLKADAENVLLSVRINVLETEMRKTKDRLDNIV
ncbi:MAG: hypothetical protein K2N77_08570 [Lachnospiraceae bacterium]|nr:hypothetical protein [Lachnospiraceae bacterium]